MSTGTVRKFENSASRCDESSRQVVRSVAREKELCQFEARMNDLVGNCTHNYEDFRMFQAEVELAWSKSPDQFNSEVQMAIAEIELKWKSIMSRLMSLIEMVLRDDKGLTIAGADKVRNHYRVLLSVDNMVHGEMPKWVADASLAALDEYERGEAEEFV